MQEYDYLSSMTEDIVNYIKDNNIENPNWDELYDELWCEDCITGNGGLYYATEFECEEFLCHNWPILAEALREFGLPEHPEDKDARWYDCTVRCFLLGQALDCALEVINNEQHGN